MTTRRALAWGLSAWAERALYVVLLFSSSDAAPPVPTASDTAAQLIELLEAGELRTLHEQHLRSTAWRRKSPRELRHATAFISEYGAIIEVTPIGVTQLHGKFQIRAERGEWELEVAITEAGLLTKFALRKIEPIPPVMHSPPLAMPVQGSWQPYTGDTDTPLDDDAERSLQRALHLTLVDADGNAHGGAGDDNRDYYAHGHPIHAVDTGQVVMVVDGVPDHAPGERGSYYLLGNTIIVRHAANLHSVYAHLRPGSARVRPGDAVQSGQVLAESGNSGYWRLPHAYVHLQDDFIVGKAWAVEPTFEPSR